MLKWGGEVTRGVGGGRVWVGSCWLAVCWLRMEYFAACTVLY